MSSLKYARGYRRSFLGKGYYVPMPTLSDDVLAQMVKRRTSPKHIIRYQHYSVIQHRKRRLPFLTAVNIDGRKLKKIRRDDVFKTGRNKWKKDKRISNRYQLGQELYKAEDSDFDIGHLVKREDVQWGATYSNAKTYARNTFFYTNAAPQHPVLNRGIWRHLEDYILHDEVSSARLKINVFTGCILSKRDPFFVNRIRGKLVQLPVYFWKIVYYIDNNKELCRVAFLVGQKELLEKSGLLLTSRSIRRKRTTFSRFRKGDTFQVNVKLIERLTGCSFHPAKDVYKDKRSPALVLEEVQAGNVNKKNIVGLNL